MEANDEDFQEKVIEQSKEKLVVVDFWADWCMPCTMIAPALEKAVESYGDKVVLIKVNVDQSPDKSNEYSINAIPAIKIFKDGIVVQDFAGVLQEEQIKEHIDKALK